MKLLFLKAKDFIEYSKVLYYIWYADQDLKFEGKLLEFQVFQWNM